MSASWESINEHLGRRRAHVTLLHPGELTGAERDSIPTWFLDVVDVDGPESVTVATEQWEDAVPGMLGDAIEMFRERAVGARLGRAPEVRGGQVVLVYALRGGDDSFACWLGYPPTDRLEVASKTAVPVGMRVDPALMPGELRRFYTRLHNRFELVGWGACGLPPGSPTTPLSSPSVSCGRT